ncbi:hypothetical protein BB468_00400 [Helicobacter pylori]|uniref:Uncharacterized protein n=1 Tax=Helicobacter pylori TaxID=210 RepID=A0AB36S454_HELPX|nr:hypothetical protein BB468_00400 [Helicobacter pylori]
MLKRIFNQAPLPKKRKTLKKKPPNKGFKTKTPQKKEFKKSKKRNPLKREFHKKREFNASF